MPLTYKKLKQILDDYGFILHVQHGSHRKSMRNWKVVLPPEHKELRPWTALSILKMIADVVEISHLEILKKYKIKL